MLRHAALWLIFLILSPAFAPAENPSDIEQRFKEAIDASTGADSANHEALMRAIVNDAPDYEPARAELGEVRVDGRWLPVGYAQHLAAEDPRQQAYRELTEAADPDSDALRLARWCEKEGLDYEARPHWLNVLKEKPRHPEALRNLNAGWRDGELWDLTLAEQNDDRRERLQHAARGWERRFQQLEERHTIRDKQLAKLSEELDAGAIEPIERRVERLAAKPNDAAAKRTRQLISAWFSAVDQLDDVEITASLCRTAILGDEATRKQAVEVLKSRPKFDTMPMLLSALMAPVESKASITRDAVGNVNYRHRLKQRSREVHKDHSRYRIARVNVLESQRRLARNDDRTEQFENLRVFFDAQMSSAIREAAFRIEAKQTEDQVATHNTQTAWINSRVMPALRAVSGVDLGEDPVDWWRYWQEESGYDEYAPVQDRSYDFEDFDYYVEGPAQRACECFVAGTPVWTRTGTKAIEELRTGDLVLARDPHLGGLVYRSVLDTTEREPSPTVRLFAGEETIVATVGHPFWVVGSGWTMAKDLAAGDLLSTVNGPLKIEAIARDIDRSAHNLIVEGAANYYVGEAGVLVHDNTPRLPAVGLTTSR